jgi:uncharacterized protein (TIGR02271 family)
MSGHTTVWHTNTELVGLLMVKNSPTIFVGLFLFERVSWDDLVCIGKHLHRSLFLHTTTQLHSVQTSDKLPPLFFIYCGIGSPIPNRHIFRSTPYTMNIQQFYEDKERREQENAALNKPAQQQEQAAQASSYSPAEGATVVPVIQEKATIHKEVVESATVRVHTQVREEEQNLSVPLTTESYEVKRVAMNSFVEERPPVRQEGNCTIVPVVEEVLVVEKRLKLVEEVHIVKRQMTTTHKEAVTLKKEDVTVERIPSNNTEHNV